MTTSVDVLIHARALVEKGWVQRTSATDKHDFGVGVSHPEACNFCMTGAIDRACLDLGVDHWDTNVGSTAMVILSKAIQSDLRNTSIVEFNDRIARDKSQVLAKFDQAIESCSS